MASVSVDEQSSRPRLKRSLGLWMATALVVGNMVGSGVFGLPASLASTGPISLLSWGFTGVGAMLLALVFANLGRAYPQTRRPVRVYASCVRRLRRLLDGMGLLGMRNEVSR